MDKCICICELKMAREPAGSYKFMCEVKLRNILIAL
jgi:hypothetical protein